MSQSIYVHNITDFNTKHIGRYLSNATIGATQAEGDDEEAVEEAEGIEKTKKTYKIVAAKPKVPLKMMNIEFFDACIDDLFENIKSCDIFLFNIMESDKDFDTIRDIAMKIVDDVEKFQKQKIIILVSTVLTWARSRIPDEDDPEIPFNDDDYCRRTAHFNYREHLALEKDIIAMGKKHNPNLLTYVIAAGLTYGEEESLFHPFFHAGWHNEPFLPVMSTGQNVVPTIHVADLAQIVQNVIEYRPKKKYILGTDDSQNSLDEIVRAISKALTTGKVKQLPKEELLTMREMKQTRFDHLLVSLRMDSAFVKEHFQVKWYCETGMVDNMKKIIKDFRLSRGFVPFRLCVLGPPCSGKSTLAKAISQHYRIPHIKIKDVLDEAIHELEVSAARLNMPDDGEGENDDDEDLQNKASEDAELLETILAGKAENNNLIELEYVTKFLRKKLKSKPCINQGFILDGYPKNREQAESLFAANADESDQEDEDVGEEEEGSRNPFGKQPDDDQTQTAPPPLPGDQALPPEARDAVLEEDDKLQKLKIKQAENVMVRNIREEDGRFSRVPLPTTIPKDILPSHIFVLNASDDFLLERIMRMPETETYGTHNNEEDFLRRLTEYRANELGNSLLFQESVAGITGEGAGGQSKPASSASLTPLAEAALDEETMAAFFEDENVPLIQLNAEVASTPLMQSQLNKIIHLMGPPRNYGLTEEEIALNIEGEARERDAKIAAANQLTAEIAQAEAAQRQLNEELWQKQLKHLREEEEQQLDESTVPIRAFLMKFVMPTVTKGLIACLQEKPGDPVDFLAEYLFKHNPQID